MPSYEFMVGMSGSIVFVALISATVTDTIDSGGQSHHLDHSVPRLDRNVCIYSQVHAYLSTYEAGRG